MHCGEIIPRPLALNCKGHFGKIGILRMSLDRTGYKALWELSGSNGYTPEMDQVPEVFLQMNTKSERRDFQIGSAISRSDGEFGRVKGAPWVLDKLFPRGVCLRVRRRSSRELILLERIFLGRIDPSYIRDLDLFEFCRIGTPSRNPRSLGSFSRNFISTAVVKEDILGFVDRWPLCVAL